MAIRERKGRSSPWEVYWINPWTKRRESRSFADRQEAEKEDSLIKHRLRFDRESFKGDVYEQETQNEESALTLQASYMLYLREKQFTKNGLSWQMNAMRYPLQKLGALPITGITKKHLERLKEEMLAMPVKPVTTRGRLSVLRTVLRWCAGKNLMQPVAFPALPPAHYEKFIPPTPEELAAMMAVAAPHIVRIIVLGSQCGVRVGPSELFRLTWDDVDFSRRVLRVHGAKKNLNAPWREVPIRESLLPLLEEWHREDAAQGIPYLVSYGGRRLSQKIDKAWKHALRRAGITRRIRPYDLRHAFATELIAGGVDIGTVAKLMGHSTPTMLLTHYQYVMDGQKRAAVEALPDIPTMRPSV